MWQLFIISAFKNLARGSPPPRRGPANMNDIKITCHHFYGAACILIYWNKNLGRGSPLSARASYQDTSKKIILPFYRAICISIYPLHSDKWVIHVTPTLSNGCSTSPPPSGREGNTPPHPRGVTMHLAPETTMTIHSWLTDDSLPGSQMLLKHTMLPTQMLSSHTTLPTWMLLSHTTLPPWMLLSHTTLPPGSRCHSLVTTAYRTWGFSNTLLTAPWVGLTNIPCMPPPLGLTLPHCHLPMGGAP